MPDVCTHGFRLGIYIFKDAEIADFAAPYGVFYSFGDSPAMDAFLIPAASARDRSCTTGACTTTSALCRRRRS